MRRRILAVLTTTFVALTLGASGAGATTIDFDGLPLGDFGGVIGGVTFTYVPLDANSVGFPLVVSTGFSTSSDPNYLGVQDQGTEFFQVGDIVNLVFATPISSLDVTFITIGGAPDGAFGLRTGATEVTSASADAIAVGVGSDEAFTLHLAPGSPFSSASLFSDSLMDGAFAFSVDDIVTVDNPVPEPGTVWLMVTSLPALGVLRRRFQNRRR